MKTFLEELKAELSRLNEALKKDSSDDYSRGQEDALLWVLEEYFHEGWQDG